MNFLPNWRLISPEFWYISCVRVHMVILKRSPQSQNKMKLSLLFVAILGVATASAVPTSKVLSRDTRSLSDDWADFYSLVDMDAILAVVVQYLAEDAEVQACVEYMQSDEFKEAIVKLESLSEYIDFLNYLDAAGLQVYYWINRFHTWIGLDTELSPSRLASARITGGVAGLWADIKALLPLTELRAMYDDKLETSEDFANLIALLKSEKAQTIYDALKANEEYQKIRAQLVAYGLDMDRFFDWLKALIDYE